MRYISFLFFCGCQLFFTCLPLPANSENSINSQPPSSVAYSRVEETTLSAQDVLKKLSDAFQLHFQHNELTAQIAQRTAYLYVKQLDPMKSLFLESEIQEWVQPFKKETEEHWKKTAKKWASGNFEDFYLLLKVAQKAYGRKKLWLEEFKNPARLEELSSLATELITSEDLEKLPWCRDPKELEKRVSLLFSLNLQIQTHLFPARLPMQHLESSIALLEERELGVNPPQLEHKSHVFILKSFLNAFDPHSSYFTHEEATRFIRDINRKFSGIGVHLREEIEGYRLVSILPGTPAESAGLKAGEHIVAVDGKSILEVDITKGVEKIQGPPGTPVSLTIASEESSESTAKTLRDVVIYRQEISLQDQRFQASYYDLDQVDEPPVPITETDLSSSPSSIKRRVLHYQLFSFYDDPATKASIDLRNEIQSALDTQEKQGRLEAVILDLRYNMGGSMAEAIHLSGLFLDPGVVLASKDQNGNILKERTLNIAPIWQGPLIVLVNRKSASSSEIVTGALKDYGRALIVGDEQTYGKGSFQLISALKDPKGALSVTQGTYYTVSGHSPQLHGITPHIIVPGRFGPVDEGEAQTQFPLPASSIEPMFIDLLEDMNFFTRQYMKSWYFKKKQEKEHFLDPAIEVLRKKSHERQQVWPENKVLENNLPTIFGQKGDEPYTDFDALQLQETLHLTRDLLQYFQENPMPDLCAGEQSNSAA